MSSEREANNHPARGSLRLAPNVEEFEEQKRKVPRQFVNFTFYRARPEWRLLSEAEKRDCKDGFVSAVEGSRETLLIHTYSTIGLRTNADFMIWRIGCELDPMQEMTARLNQTAMAKYVEPTHSLLSMTKRSMFIGTECADTSESHTHIVSGESDYLFVCPVQRTREWYARPQEQRQEMLEENLRIGSKYRSVKLHTTYSFGLDDQDFVVVFETDKPADVVDLFQELRETKAGCFTLRDTPIFTCRRRTLSECLDALG
ncbi:MAG TPA: chlorite dismutase family protein [Pyrinomonadaceae bacterium]|nr:chlorite dismutase family protein [Pyrinomonadaceae bacterium]